MILKNWFKSQLGFILSILLIAVAYTSCVGSVKETNPKPTKSASVQAEPISFSGLIKAEPVSDSKVLLSWLPAPGLQSNLTYLIYINGSTTPVEVSGASLNPDYSGVFNFTVGSLIVNTTYSFAVGVRDNTTGVKTENDKVIFAKTFSNFTANFSGISSVYPAAGEAGKTEVVVEWVPAATLGSQFSPRSTDPIAYEVRYIKASDGGPQELKNRANPNVTSLQMPTTLTSNTQLSTERKRNVAGLLSGTKYFFLVRAIHKSYVAFRNQLGYKLEENLQVLEVETIDNAGILDWDSDSVRVKSVPGEVGLTNVDVKWDIATGLFSKYRVYNIKVADSDKSLTDAEGSAPSFDSAFYDDQNDLVDGYSDVPADDNFLRLSGLDPYAYYKTSVVVCATDVCDQVNRIPGTARIYRVIPDRAPFSGLLSVNNPTSLSEINQGSDSLDTVTLGFDPPVVSAGIVNKMELYCYSSLSDSTPLLLETGISSGTGKLGCENITRMTPTPVSLSAIGDFTSIRVEADFIQGSNAISSRPYCFSLVPVIEDLTSGYVVRDLPNAVVKCKVFEITIPKNNEFLGARKACNTSGETITVSWELPSSGIYNNFEIFYKISDGQGFKFSDAIDPSNTDYSRIDSFSSVATSGDISGLLPGQIYTFGVLSYIIDGGGVKTYSEFNSGIQSCQVPFPTPLFKEWIDIFAVGPKVDGRVPQVLDIGETEGRKTTLFETLNRFGQPIEVEIDVDSAPTTNHSDQFGNISSSSNFDGIYGKPNADIQATELHQYSNSGIIRIAFKDITFENNTISMLDLIQSKGDDLEPKPDRKYGYRIYRSADNGITFQDLTSKDNPFQTTNNSGLLHPVNFSEKPRINGTQVTFKAVSFVDYSVKALPENQSRERARVYLYKVVPVVDGTELLFPEDGGKPKNIIKVILPPANMALVNRYIANRQMCMELGKSYYRDRPGEDGEADFENYYACEWNGLGSVGKSKPYVIGNTVYDFGSDMLIDRYELGCNMTRGHQGNDDSNFSSSPSEDFQGTADSGQKFKGCLQIGSASSQQTDQRAAGDQGTPWDPSYKTWMKGDCVTQSNTLLNGGTTICLDPTRRIRYRSYLPGIYSIQWNGTTERSCGVDEKWLFDNYFDPYTTVTPKSDTWLARVAQSEFLAVMHHSQATAYESYYSKEYRGAAVGGVDKPITVTASIDRISRCSINIPVVDINDGGNHVPRWFSANDLNNLRHDGVDFNILESTVGEIIDTASSVGSKLYTLGGGGKAALPPSTFTESYNGRYINETPIAKVFTSNNAKLPPITSINIDDANTICRQYQVDVGSMGESAGDSFTVTEGSYRKRIMRRPEGIIANKHPESFTENYANTIDNGTASQEQPISAGVPFNPSCNSFNRNVDGTVLSDGGGQSILTRFPTNRNSGGNDRVEFITGSSFYDPEGENFSSQHCVSRYGVQDLIGNFVEFSSEKIFCEFSDEALWWGQDGVVTNSVNEADVSLIGQLFDRNTIVPWVLSGADTGRCSMVEDGSDRNYNPATGGTMIPLFNGVGQLNTDIVSTLVYNDPGFRLMYRNGDGYFLDFGQGSLAAPLSVNDTISLRYTTYINNRRKESPGDPRGSNYFNPIVGFPLTCSNTSCNQSTDNRSITTSDFITLRSFDSADFSVPNFPIGNSNISSSGMSEITSSTAFTLPNINAEGDVTFVESIHPDGDSGQSNDYITVQTRPFSDQSQSYVLNRVNWDLSRNNAGSSIYNFGGSNRQIGTGRYSLEFVNTNFSEQERSNSRLGFRCVLRIKEETY